jgi:hypothetical protein
MLPPGDSVTTHSQPSNATVAAATCCVRRPELSFLPISMDLIIDVSGAIWKPQTEPPTHR